MCLPDALDQITHNNANLGLNLEGAENNILSEILLTILVTWLSFLLLQRTLQGSLVRIIGTVLVNEGISLYNSGILICDVNYKLVM